MLELHVEGMTCGHCVKAVTKAIEGAQPSAKVDIDLASGKVRVAQADQPQGVAAAITEAGYKVLSSDRR